MNERVIVYIDGFNLYFDLKSAGWKRFYWLNLKTMAQNLLKAGQDLVFTKYFTSRVSYPADKERRQSTFKNLSMICSRKLSRTCWKLRYEYESQSSGIPTIAATTDD